MPEYIVPNGNGLALPRRAVMERADTAPTTETLQRMNAELDILQERIAELEFVDPTGWDRLGGGASTEFSRRYLDYIIRHSRLNYIKNPLINHAVDVQAHYVFSEPVNVSADNSDINDVIQRFWDDYDNLQELTGHQALQAKERTLSQDANIFFVFFPMPKSGRIKMRSIPVDEISEIYTNPEDRKEPWFYKRTWMQTGAKPERERLYAPHVRGAVPRLAL